MHRVFAEVFLAHKKSHFLLKAAFSSDRISVFIYQE